MASRFPEDLPLELERQDDDAFVGAVDELDVGGILAFAEHILPRTSDLWPQALDYKQRLQPLFFPEGIAYDGNRFNPDRRTGTTFQLLGAESADERMVSLTFATWNQIASLLQGIDRLRVAA